MENEYIRDAAMYAAIFGVFGFAWFGWAQENPPRRLRAPLGIGSILCFIIGCVGGYLAVKNWNSGSALEAAGAYQAFGVVVAIEIVVALAGAIILIRHKKQRHIAAWIAFVVGIHFIPLVALFHDPWLYLLAFVVSSIAIFSIRKTPKTLKQNTFVCLATGVTLLLFALRGLVLFIAA